MRDDSECRTPVSRSDSHLPETDPSRRKFIALLAFGAATAFFPGIAAASPPPLPKARRISFHNLHTDERFSACYWERGRYVPAALGQIDTILRDHRTGEVRRIDPRLIDLVFALTLRLENTAPVQVISGYRSAATNALLRADDPRQVAARSLHLTGEAVDIRLEDRPLHRVRDAALSLRRGGVGYYPDSGFVHLDIGRPRRW
jgi:uncharacterized protein YcbK (DUF882 family)